MRSLRCLRSLRSVTTREIFLVLETLGAASPPAWSAMVPPPARRAGTRLSCSVAPGAAARGWSSVRTTSSASQSRVSAAELGGDITGTWPHLVSEVAPTPQKCAPSNVFCLSSVLKICLQSWAQLLLRGCVDLRRGVRGVRGVYLSILSL